MTGVAIRSSVLRVLACAAAFAACGAIAARADAPASRIVSTSPSVTETLFALGLGDRVVGVSRYCRYPDGVRALPKVGTFLRPDAELIARLRPDLVIVTPDAQSRIEAHLSTLGIRHVSVARGTLAGVYSTIRVVGEAAGVPDRAEALVADIRRELDRVKAAVAGRPARRMLLLVGRRPGMLADLVGVGHDSYLNDVIAIAGGVNVLDDPALPQYPHLSLESILRLAPDVIVDAADDMGDAPEARGARRAQTERLWQAQPLVAASGSRVYVAATEAFVVPGPRVVEVARALAAWLHGARFP